MDDNILIIFITGFVGSTYAFHKTVTSKRWYMKIFFGLLTVLVAWSFFINMTRAGA